MAVSPEAVSEWAVEALSNHDPSRGPNLPDPSWSYLLPRYLSASAFSLDEQAGLSAVLAFGDGIANWFVLFTTPSYLASLEHVVAHEWRPNLYFCYEDVVAE